MILPSKGHYLVEQLEQMTAWKKELVMVSELVETMELSMVSKLDQMSV